MMNSKIPPHLAVIDWNLGASRVSGDLAFARELLDTLIASLPEAKTQLRTYFETKNWEKLRSEAHKLRGASSYCATPRLTEAAKILDTALKQQTDCQAPYDLLMQEIDAVLRTDLSKAN